LHGFIGLRVGGWLAGGLSMAAGHPGASGCGWVPWWGLLTASRPSGAAPDAEEGVLRALPGGVAVPAAALFGES
jgi:hypothetical protein